MSVQTIERNVGVDPFVRESLLDVRLPVDGSHAAAIGHWFSGDVKRMAATGSTGYGVLALAPALLRTGTCHAGAGWRRLDDLQLDHSVHLE